jgi:magnesium-transporting ATPase (P-type)
MMNMINKFGIDIDDKRKKHLPDPLTRFGFTSKRKRMSTIMQNCGKTEFGYDKRIHLKGAAEIVLESCTHYLD